MNANFTAKRALATMAPTSPSIQLDPGHRLVRLWRALLDDQAMFQRRKKSKGGDDDSFSMDTEAAESTEDTGALELPEGVFWLHSPASRQLYVRPCSWQLCDLIDERRPRGRGAVVRYSCSSFIICRC